MMPQVRKGTLDVYLLGRLVGRIDYTSHHNEMRFAYDAGYLLRQDAAPLSFSLPLQASMGSTGIGFQVPERRTS